MVTFEEFQKAFLGNLRSREFAREPYSQRGAKSPAAKELELKRAYDVFSHPFLMSVYRLLIEHSRLANEQRKIDELAKRNRIKLIKLGNAIETVMAVKKRLRGVQGNTQGLIEPEVWERVQRALSDCESEVRKAQVYWASVLHPDKRGAYSSKVRWEHVLKLYKYDLPSLKKKAPDQWLYQTLNDELIKALAKSKISAMTRYRIMSALLSAFGLKAEPGTLKSYCPSKQPAAKSPVEKS
jgi:hypothetical protein